MGRPLAEEDVSEAAESVGGQVERAQGSLFRRVFGTLADNAHYRTYWYGYQVTAFVMLMQGVANGYLAYTLTNSATALGIVGVASSIPILVFSPLGGVLADRVEKRRLLIMTQVLQCVTSVVMGILVATGQIEYWHLLVSAVLQGIGYAVIVPTRQSWMPHLVGVDELTSALALNNAGLNASRVTGPAVAGILIGIPWFGVEGVFFLRVVGFAWVLYSLLQIPIRGEPEARAPDVAGTHRLRTIGTDLTAGLRYIWSHDTLVSLFIVAVVTMLLGQSYQQLLPAYALGVFNVGPEGQGLMQTVVGGGALVGSLTMAYLSRHPSRAKIQAVTGIGLGLVVALFGVSAALHQFIAALLSLFLIGLMLDFNATINQTLIMLNSERAVYGRVMSVYAMTFALSGFSASASGYLMDTVGGAATMLVQGIALTTFVVLMAVFNSGYKHIRNSIAP